MDLSELAPVVASSSLAELSWVGARGPVVRGVVALLRGPVPVVALTWAAEDVAREVAAAPAVALSLTEPRSTGRAFQPTVLHGRAHLVEDPTGHLFQAELLDQELRRHPPSRVLADSPLLRREHWWYLPRLVLELRVDRAEPLVERAAPRDLLLVSDQGGPVVQVAGIRDQGADRVELDVEGVLPEEGTRCVLFGQDASFPDLERWNQWHRRGTWTHGGLAVEHAGGVPGLRPTPGLWQRWRDQRMHGRACRQALDRAAGRARAGRT